MSDNSNNSEPEASPILLVPYMWIGDFVRCHSVIKLLRARYPGRPIDVLTTTLCAPLLDYMPGVRGGIIVDLPRRRLAFGQHLALARRLRAERYGNALVMPRTWKNYFAASRSPIRTASSPSPEASTVRRWSASPEPSPCSRKHAP